MRGRPRRGGGTRLPPSALVATLAGVLSIVPTATAQVEGGDPGGAVTIARLEYGPGDWYANPSSLPNLLAFVEDAVGLPVAGREAVVKATDPDLSRYPLLYLTGHGEIRFSDREVESLRAYLSTGGFLHADDNFGIDESLRREIGRLFPDEPLVEIPRGHPIYRSVFDFPDGLPKIHEHAGGPPRAYGVFRDGRLVLLYTHNTDLGDGWEDPDVHGDPEQVRRAALRMGANIVVHALTH